MFSFKNVPDIKQFPICLNFLEIPLTLAQHVYEEGHNI
jgi:hypothetical protein